MAEKHLECSGCVRNTSVLLVEIGLGFFSKTLLCCHCPRLAKTWSLRRVVGSGQQTVIRCPTCETLVDSVKQGSPIGCSGCYYVFSDFLTGSDILDGRRMHVGRVPGGEMQHHSLCNQLSVLNEKLKTVLEVEDYEEAAKIRDQIREILGIEGQEC